MTIPRRPFLRFPGRRAAALLLVAWAGGALPAALAGPAPPQGIDRPAEGGVVTIRSAPLSPGRPSANGFVGISSANSGASSLSLRRLVLPPGGRGQPHRHPGVESAIYLLQGTVETRYGPRLERSVVNHAGDFLFIPAGLPHQPINRSASEPAIAIEARSDPSERGGVEPVPVP